MKNEHSDKAIDKTIIDGLRLKIRSMIKEADEYERMAQGIRERIKNFESTIRGLGGRIDVSKSSIDKSAGAGKTFAQVVKEIFSDGVPRTSRQLYNEYLTIGTNANIKSFYDFSGRFSNIMKKAGISKHMIPDNPLPTRFVYGLTEWFNGETLKDEYFSKVKLD